MALTFSGTGQYLTLPTAVAAGTPLTFACWFNVTTFATSQALMALSNNSTDNSNFIDFLITTPRLRAQTGQGGTSNSAASGAAPVITTGTWFHAVAIFTSPTSRSGYINGTVFGPDTGSKTPVGLNITSIGANFGGTATPVNLTFGSIAYPAIWNAALSGANVAALYNAGAGADPVTVLPGNLLSLLYMQSGIPYFDNKRLTTWTVVGAPTVVADPFTVTQSRALSGTATATGAHTGALGATKKHAGTCTVTTANTGLILSSGDRPVTGTCIASAVNTGQVVVQKRLFSLCAVQTNNTGALTVHPVNRLAGTCAVHIASYAMLTGNKPVVIDPVFPAMQWTNIGASPIVLFLLTPNFATEIKVTLSVMDMAQVTQNNKSSTRSFTDKGRYTIEMECLCANAQESTEVRLGLNRLKNEYVALPLWVDNVVLTAQVLAGASSASYSSVFPPARYGPYWIFIDLDLYVFEILTGVSVTGTTITFSTPTVFTWPKGSLLMPLIFGRFSASNPPTFTKLTESVNTLAFTFEESSPIGNAINPFPSVLPVVQANLGLAGPARIWTVPCTYSSSETDNVVVDIDYERIGFVREDAAYTYPQAPRRITELSFELCTRQTIAQMESIFIDRRGRTVNLWVPTFRNDADLVSDQPGSNPQQIQIDSSSRYLDTNFTTHPGYPYLCLNDNTGQAIFPFKIASLGGDLLQTNVPITQSFKKSAKISALILSRFQDSQIQWTYRTNGYAYTTIKWVEATEDYSNPPFEEFIAQGFHFYNFNDAGNLSLLYTNFESTLVVPGLGTLVPGLFSHGEIKTGLDMGSDTADIMSFQFPGNPLSLLMPWTLVGDLNVDIYDINRLSLTWDLLFRGTVEELDTEGAKITAKVLGFSSLYDQQFHRHVMAGDCPYAVFSPECGAGRNAANTVTVTITGITGNNIIVSPPVGGPGNVFANGVCQINTASQVQFLHITANNATSFQLSRPPVNTPIGSIATISLGCDGTSVQCEGFFNNLVNFGGEDNIPPTNPSVTAVTTKNSSSTTSNK